MKNIARYKTCIVWNNEPQYFYFYCRCGDIANRYDYTVEYSGIGEAPSDSKHLGCCSQAAVFTRKSPVKTALEEGTSVDCYSLVRDFWVGNKDFVSSADAQAGACTCSLG